MKMLARSLLLCALMFGAAGMAVTLRPHQRIADQGPQFELETLIPEAFGEWRSEPTSAAQIVDPQQQEMLNKIYSKTLSRTYVNPQGYRIMLSIAYGRDQTDTAQVHKPEVCYPAQGFVLHDRHVDVLQHSAGSIPITRLSTSLGPRKEPVSYWIMIGETVIKTGSFDKKLVELGYGLRGKIPDGILIRASSIDADTANAYTMQDQFSKQMIEAVTPALRWRVTGKPESKQL
ncbi:MAG: EpsI family protein [Burkholderiales bacterium]|nr:EpsI family protein [Burkholderiales bacterium]